MKNVILHYPFNKTFKEHKFKVTEIDPSSVLRKRISAELPSFKNVQYLLILKKYDNCLSFLQEDKPFNKLFNENRIHIQLVIPQKEAEFLLPNQSVVHLPIDLTKSVSENVKTVISYIQSNDKSNSIMKNNEDFIFESFTFFFTPIHSVFDGFDDSVNDTNNNNNDKLNPPKIVSSSLPLLFQGWSGERLTLIRRINTLDLIIADERWKRREEQIQKMKQSFEDSKNNANNIKKNVQFDKAFEQGEPHLSLIEKSKSTSNIDFTDQEIETSQENDNKENINTLQKNNSTLEENFFDFTTEDFFYNCQLAVLNKLCIFDLNTWCALACLQYIASHTNIKHMQIQNLLPFIPDSLQNATKENEQSNSNLTNILNEMKRKYSKYEKMQAMRTYIQLCINTGETFCYSEDVKFLLLTKKWRVSSHRIIYISSNKISIAKDENSTTFLYQSNISNIIGVSFDGDFIVLTFEVYGKNNEQNRDQNPGTLSVQMEKWRIKSRYPQILIYMINELRSIIYQSSRTLSNLPGSPPSLSKMRSTDFRNLVSHQRAKSSGMLMNLLLKPNTLKKSENEKASSSINYNDDTNDNDSILIRNDFSDANLTDFYFDNFEPSIEFDSYFVEPGISKLICSSKEDADKPCFDLLVKEQSKKLNLLKKLYLPYQVENLNLNSENSSLSLNSYSGLDNMSEVPDINWLLNINKFLSLSQKNGKIIIIIGIVIILFYVFTLLK